MYGINVSTVCNNVFNKPRDYSTKIKVYNMQYYKYAYLKFK